MAYIYKITNNINNKIYIGKTEHTVEKRFKEHCQYYKKREFEKRPLYSAMNKYGIENFAVETIEETDNPEEREKYWIEYYGSFKNGYNATVGGDGKPYLDYELLIKTYQEVKNLSDTAKILNIDEGHLSNILKARNVNVLTVKEVNTLKYGKTILMLDKNSLKPLKSFACIADASRYIQQEKNIVSDLKGMNKHIREVAYGKRKTAYNYAWKFL
ncbi:MAG: GIY-YIG nuclease family protein [Clostridia bacterium]|nr:GIY-YIG nuclease family protein [Clostridia bacterium]